jgi:hypothetical protein
MTITNYPKPTNNSSDSYVFNPFTLSRHPTMSTRRIPCYSKPTRMIPCYSNIAEASRIEIFNSQRNRWEPVEAYALSVLTTYRLGEPHFQTLIEHDVSLESAAEIVKTIAGSIRDTEPDELCAAVLDYSASHQGVLSYLWSSITKVISVGARLYSFNSPIPLPEPMEDQAVQHPPSPAPDSSVLSSKPMENREDQHIFSSIPNSPVQLQKPIENQVAKHTPSSLPWLGTNEAIQVFLAGDISIDALTETVLLKAMPYILDFNKLESSVFSEHIHGYAPVKVSIDEAVKTRVFSLSSRPDLIFKMEPPHLGDLDERNQLLEDKFLKIVTAETIRIQNNFALLEIPRTRKITVDFQGQKMVVLAQEKVKIQDEAFQEELRDQHATTLTAAYCQLAKFLMLTRLNDFTSRNIRVLENSLDENGNRKMAIIDLDGIESIGQSTEEKIEMGLRSLIGPSFDISFVELVAGFKFEDEARVNFYGNPVTLFELLKDDQIPVIISEIRSAIGSASYYSYYFQIRRAAERQMWVNRNRHDLAKFYEKKGIVRGNEPISLDVVNHLGLPSNRIESAKKIIEAINQQLEENYLEFSKEFPDRLPALKVLRHVQLGGGNIYVTKEIADKLVEHEVIFAIARGYILQA